MQSRDPGKRLAAYAAGMETVLFLALCVAVAAIAAGIASTQGWSGGGSRQLITLVVIFAAGVVASVAGFAFSALAAALLSHLYPNPVEMVAILLVSSIAAQSYCLAKLWMHIRWSRVLPYLVGGVTLLPMAVHFLAGVSPEIYGTILGLFLLAYALVAMFVPANARLQAPRGSALVIGALGGLTGGLAAFPGAFVTMWCSLQGLPKEEQRALCQPYILVMQVLTLVLLHEMAGIAEQTSGPLWIYVPVALLSACTGMRLFAKLSDRQFRKMIVVMLTVSGLLLSARNNTLVANPGKAEDQGIGPPSAAQGLPASSSLAPVPAAGCWEHSLPVTSIPPSGPPAQGEASNASTFDACSAALGAETAADNFGVERMPSRDAVGV